MNIKSTFCVVLMLSLSFSGSAQKVTRSRQVPGLRNYDTDLAVMSREEKDSVRMVMELWKNYVDSYSSASVSEQERRSMWVDGMQDYLAEFDDGVLLYSSFRENKVLDVRKIASGTYQLSVMTGSKLPGEDFYGWNECVYRVCAMAVARSDEKESRHNPFRLCNWLDAVIPTLAKTEVGKLDYYCAPGCKVPLSNAVTVARFVDALSNEYGFGFDRRIRYVVAPTVDQCEQFSGFLFNAYSNPLMSSAVPKAADFKFYGRAFGLNTLVSNYYDDLHELALLVVRTCRPEAFAMIQEGFATFHGGYMTNSYESLKKSLKLFIESHEEIDFSDEDLFYDLTMPLKGVESTVVVPLEGMLGALFVECAWENGGDSLVKELLACKDYTDVLKVFHVDPDDAGVFIKKLL